MFGFIKTLDWPTLVIGAVLGAIAKYIADKISIKGRIRTERQRVEIERSFGELSQSFSQWKENKPYKWTDGEFQLKKNSTYFNDAQNMQPKLEDFRDEGLRLAGLAEGVLSYKRILTDSESKWATTALAEICSTVSEMTTTEFGEALSAAFQLEKIVWDNEIASKIHVTLALDKDFKSLVRLYKENPELFTENSQSAVHKKQTQNNEVERTGEPPDSSPDVQS
jgi:hypothetical protein